MITDDMRALQLLIFEAGPGCNLSHLHHRCPASVGDRWRGARDEPYLTDEQIVSAAVSAIRDHGFRGVIGFHYYNEPLLYIDRIHKIATSIRDAEPRARFGLWTNGSVIVDPGMLSIFERAWVSKYNETLPYIEQSGIPKVIPQSGVLDDRLRAVGNPTCCWRPFIELVFDCRGFAHLCCAAYHADEAVGNLHSDSMSDIVSRYCSMRDSLRTSCAQPPICTRCGSAINALYGTVPRCAAVLLIKDEIDMIPAWYQHYRNLVDLVVITDNNSSDGTREWLAEREASDAGLIVLDEPGNDYRQAEWTNRMLDICRDHGYSWAIPADTDELWTFRDGRRGLDDVLFTHRNAKAVRIPSFTYMTTKHDDQAVLNPTDRMRHRRPQPDSTWAKVMVRTDADVRVELGNHYACLNGIRINAPEVSADSAQICHYPERSWAHYRRKVIHGGEVFARIAHKHPHGTAYQWVQPFAVFRDKGLPWLWQMWRDRLPDVSTLAEVPYADVFSSAPTPAPVTRHHVNTTRRRRQQVIHRAQAQPAPAEPAQQTVALYVVATAYRVPSQRTRDWLSWNEQHGLPVILVVDPDADISPPSWVTLIRFNEPMPQFALSWTSNRAIRYLIDNGFSGSIMKTDIDIAFQSPFAWACRTLRQSQVLVPHYRMGNHPTDTTAEIWPATCGTIAAMASAWQRICGYDERQTGYGVDDGDCLDRFRKAGYSIDRMHSVVHVAHEPGTPQIRGRNDQWNRDSINPLNHGPNQKVRRESLWCDASWGTVHK